MTISSFIGSPNCTIGRSNTTIDRIVIHWADGDLASTDQVFQDTIRDTSAHYGIEDNTIHQYVEEANTAYHSGEWNMNLRSIGIEHSAQPGRDASEATYETSAQLIAGICSRYGIPLDREHIIKHNQVVPTECPGTIDIDKLINLAGGNMEVVHATADEVKQAYQEIVNRAPTGDEVTQWTQNGTYKEMITGLLPASVVGPQNDQINKLTTQVSTLDAQVNLLTAQNKDLQDKLSKLALDKAAAESSAQMLQDELTAARAQGVKPSFVQQLAQYNKFWVALAGVGVTVLTQHFGVGSTIVTDTVAVLSALGVVIVPNKN